MAAHSLKKMIRIHAPEDRVFAYVADPAHNPEWMPNVVEVTNISGPQNVGTTWAYHYAFAGTHHKGVARTTDYEQNKHIGVKTEGDIFSEWQFRFEPDGEYTRLTVEFEYNLSDSLLGKFEAPVLRMLHDNAAEHALQNLKTHLE